MSDQIDCTWEDILPDGELPGDVMVSILSNLPVKSLLRFKAVRKSWCSLISSPLFIKLHLHRQSVINANVLLLSWENIEYEQNTENAIEYTELSLLSHNYDISKILPPWSPVEEGVYIIDSCKGLVCIRNLRYGCIEKHMLWNPATRRYRFLELPMKSSCESFVIKGLGFVDATNDYKIVGLGFTQAPADEQCMFVYTLSSDSWKELDYSFENFPTYPVPTTFINGCIHWLGNTCTCRSMCTCSSLVNVIFAFDVEDEVMCCFGVPDNYDPRSNLSMQTLVIKGCLSVVIFPESQEEMESGIEIWVMVEYGVQGSWVKQFTIEMLTTIQLPLRSWKESEIVFMYLEEGSQKLMFYESSSKKNIFFAPFFEVSCFFCIDTCQVFNYVESLASVDQGRKCSLQPLKG